MFVIARHFTVLLEEQEAQKRTQGYIVYHRCLKSSRVFLHDCTAIPPLAVLLFGGNIVINRSRDTITVGHHVLMRMSELHAVLCKRIHAEFENVLQMRLQIDNSMQDSDEGSDGQLIHDMRVAVTTAETLSSRCQREAVLRKVLHQLLQSDALRY